MVSTTRPVARRVGVAFLVAAAIAVLGTSCASSDGEPTATPGGTDSSGASTPDVSVAASGQPTPGGRLTYGLEAETDGFDPTSSRWAISALMVANAIYDPLVAYDENLEPQPYTLESYTVSDDSRVWTAKIREGITFHDGTPYDAEAVASFTRRVKDSILTGPAARPIDTVDVIDDYTIQVNMSVPWVAFPHLLTAQGGMVPSLRQWEDPDGKANPVGSGPFKFGDWDVNSKLIVTRNDGYWRKDDAGNALPYLDEVEFRIVPDVQSRVAALQSGTLDAMHASNDTEISRLRELAASGAIQVVTDTGPQEKAVLMMNTAKAPLDDVRLRRALAMAVDRDMLATLFEIPPENVADGPVSDNSPFYVDPGFPPYDPEGARRLVDEVRAEKGEFSISIGTTPTPDAQKITQAVAEQLRQAGIEVTQRDYEQATFIVNVITGDYDVVLWRQYGAIDPDSEYHWWHSSTAADIGSVGLNMSRVEDPSIDEALDLGRQTADEATRKQAYGDLQRRFSEVLPYVWLNETTWVVAAGPDVRDVTNGPLPDGTPARPMVNGWHRLTTAWLDQNAG